MKTILVVLGTRPEAIKLAPVALAMKARQDDVKTVLCSTGQHREMLDSALSQFGLQPDIDLNVMQPNQHLTELLARLLVGLRNVIRDVRPDAVLVQGDTTTVVAEPLAAFADRVPIGHVEAGLRTQDRNSPFPEEVNRRIASVVADWHFAPTPRARDNLLAERIDPASITVTGNTVVDALWWMRDRLTSSELPDYLPPGRRLIFLTAHRRENLGEPLRQALKAVRKLADAYDDIQVVYPVHLNPQVQETAREVLTGHPRITLIAPVDYQTAVLLMSRAYFIVTDSGGIQEEALSLGKPVLVLRNESERPEGVSAGVVRLVGVAPRRIWDEATRLLDDPAAYAAASRSVVVYGDGLASIRIADLLIDGRSNIPEFVPEA